MAAIDTFEWFVQKFYPSPDEASKRHLEEERQYILSIRNENERLRYIHTLMKQQRAQQSSSAAPR